MKSARNIVNVHCLSLQALIKARHLPPEQKCIKEIKVLTCLFSQRCLQICTNRLRNGNMTYSPLCLCYWRTHLLEKELHFVQLASQQMLLEQPKSTSPCFVVSTSHFPSVSFRTCMCCREKTVPTPASNPLLLPQTQSRCKDKKEIEMNKGDKGDVAETLPNLSKVYFVAVVIIMLMMLFDGLSDPIPLAPLALILGKMVSGGTS